MEYELAKLHWTLARLPFSIRVKMPIQEVQDTDSLIAWLNELMTHADGQNSYES